MREKKHISKFKLITVICMIIGCLFILVPLLLTIRASLKNKSLEKFYTQINPPLVSTPKMRENISHFISSSREGNKIKAKAEKEEDENQTTPQIMDKYTQLLQTNQEVIGWIQIDHTTINYPILQHSDNAYYLTKDIKHQDSVYGSIFLDYRNNKQLSDKNSLIYGHNMRDHSMFNQLLSFKEQDFFEANKYIYLSTLYEESTWEIFSVYIVDANKETVSVDYEADEVFEAYLEACATRSLYKRDVALSKDDQIITLVTCSYELENARTIVQAKRLL